MHSQNLGGCVACLYGSSLIGYTFCKQSGPVMSVARSIFKLMRKLKHQDSYYVAGGIPQHHFLIVLKLNEVSAEI